MVRISAFAASIHERVNLNAKRNEASKDVGVQVRSVFSTLCVRYLAVLGRHIEQTYQGRGTFTLSRLSPRYSAGRNRERNVNSL